MIMSKKLHCILLVDDDKACNFFHQRLLKEMDCAENIEVATDGRMALDLLKSRKCKPDIIFLDINMPKMDGWEFLAEYEQLPADEKATTIIAMVTSSLNPDDKAKSEAFTSVKGFNSKYLNEEVVKSLLERDFADYL